MSKGKRFLSLNSEKKQLGSDLAAKWLKKFEESQRIRKKYLKNHPKRHLKNTIQEVEPWDSDPPSPDEIPPWED